MLASIAFNYWMAIAVDRARTSCFSRSSSLVRSSATATSPISSRAAP
jgi:hypothetical protein